jgi:hypothetical protein
MGYAHKIASIVRRIDPWNYENGLTWYEFAHKRIEDIAIKHNLSVSKVCAIVAVLSPSCNWGRNIIDAIDIIENGEDAIVTTYSANRQKALSILASQERDYYKYVRGNKVKSFYANLYNPDSSCSVTLDRHMLKALIGHEDKKAYNRIFASSNNYQHVAEYVRVKAHKLNIKPCQLQAAIWLQVR